MSTIVLRTLFSNHSKYVLCQSGEQFSHTERTSIITAYFVLYCDDEEHARPHTYAASYKLMQVPSYDYTIDHFCSKESLGFSLYYSCSGQGMALTTHPHLRLGYRKSRAIPLLPLWVFVARSRVNFTFLHVHETQKMYWVYLNYLTMVHLDWNILYENFSYI